MDHKGPEHHYDEIDCPECGAFFQQGEIQPETVHNSCPECGYDLRSSTGGRPYRGQPSDINSEMTERNTPLDGASEDRGGNPFKEGILANLKDKKHMEELEELDEATEPAGLGETHPVKDNQWKPGDKGGSMGRDEMLGSVRNSGEHSWSDPGDDNNQELWDQVVEDFENAKAEPHQSTNKIAAAPWLDEEPDNFPVEQLGWDIVEVVEPSKELTEAVNKYSMPMPEGITDNLHEALIAVNAWVENPEENGKLRPYKEYWSVIRPKITQGNVRIGVEDPHMADIINDVARTNSLSALDKTSNLNKIGEWTDWITPAAIAAGTILAPEIALPLEGAALAEGAVAGGTAAAEAAGVAGAETSGGGFLSGVGNLMKGALGKKDLTKELAKSTGKEIVKDVTGWGSGPGAAQQQAAPAVHDQSYYAKTAYVNLRNQILTAMRQKIADRYRYIPEIHDVMTPAELAKSKQERKIPESEIVERQKRDIQRAQETGYGTGVSTGPNWKSTEPTERRQPQIPGTGTTDVPGRFMLPKLKMPIDPTTGEEVVGVDGPMSWEVEGYGQEEPQQQVQQPQPQPQTSPTPQTPQQPQTPTGGQDNRGKWLGYGMGAIPGVYNWLFNNPNKALQTKPWDLPVRNEEYYAGPRQSSYGDEYEHPSSITRRIEDPENIDPHQRSDESNDDWAYDMLDVNEIGSTHDPRGKDDAKERIRRQFAANATMSDSIKQFMEFLPLIMEFFYSEESGLDHPTIKLIHDNLESEHPGYLDLATDEDQYKILITIDNYMNKKESAATVSPQSMQQIPTMGVNGVCPKCGSDMGPDQVCQQCTPDTAKAFSPATRPNITLTPELNITGARMASNTQGPHTDEQQNAFIEHLHEMFEAGELDEEQVAQLESMMFNEPSNPEVTKIWSEIANQDELFDAAPEDMAPSPQEQMQGMGAPGMPPAPGGDMGMGGPPGPAGPAPGIPDMSAPTPADLNPAGPGAMPPPIMSSVRNDMLKSILKHAADSAASTCPKCDGHTTGVVNQSTGGCECRSCGHKWDDKNLIPSDGTSTDTSTTSSFYQALNLDEGPTEVMPGSVDSFSEPEELEEDDSTHTWADDSGEPLEEGKEYEIYAHNYEIPDVGRVVEVKPDSIVYEIESNGGLRTTIEIDRKEADLNGYRFVSTDFGSEENPAGIEENMDSKNVTAPGQDSDLSTPHIQIGSSVKTSGQHYTPMQQRELIDEYGEARNADKLNLEGTHYADSDPDYFLFGC